MIASYVLLVEGCGEWDCGIGWRSNGNLSCKAEIPGLLFELMNNARPLPLRLPAPAAGAFMEGRKCEDMNC